MIQVIDEVKKKTLERTNLAAKSYQSGGYILRIEECQNILSQYGKNEDDLNFKLMYFINNRANVLEFNKTTRKLAVI